MRNLFVVILLFILVISCEEKKTSDPASQSVSKASTDGCDSLAITKAILKKVYSPNFAKDEYFNSLKDLLPGYIYTMSQVIERPEATNSHIRYLQSQNPILDKNRDIVHYLKIEKNDLDNIAKNGLGGARLYFCNEDQATGPKTIFNIIMVPVNSNGDNVLNDAQGNSTIVNKLDPCPDNCINGNYASTNSKNDLNFDTAGGRGERWYKPNKNDGTSKNHWWNVDNSQIKD